MSWGDGGLPDRIVVANQHGHIDWRTPQHDQYGQQSAGSSVCFRLSSRVWAAAFMSRLIRRETALRLRRLIAAPADVTDSSERTRSDLGVRPSRRHIACCCDPQFRAGDRRNGFDQLLSSTAICVRRDVAISETDNWQHACQTVSHPATTVINLRDGCWSSGVGASLEIGWPVRPLVVGRWGWSDPGRDAVLSGVDRYEAGERLGDLVLAAEQSVGKGTVVVLGNGDSLTNEGIVRGYRWAGRLLSYLANRRGNPMATWRQVATLLLSVLLLVTLCRGLDAGCLIGTALVLAVSLAVSATASRSMTRIIPDGRWIADQDVPTASVSDENETENWPTSTPRTSKHTATETGRLTL